MARLSEQAKGIAYPQMSAADVNAVIRVMIYVQRSHRDRDLSVDEQSAFNYLVGFYTRLWGLPPAIAARGD